MPTARTIRPTRTKSPTRNSDQVSCLRCAIRGPSASNRGIASDNYTRESNQKALEIGILGSQELFRRAFEIDTRVAQDEKARGSAGMGSGRVTPHAFGLGIEI